MSTAARYFGLFLEEARELYVEGATALRDTDTDAFLRVTHTLKGMSGTMGYKRLAQALHELESAARNGTLPTADSPEWQALGVALDRAQATQSDTVLHNFTATAAAAPALQAAPQPVDGDGSSWWRLALADDEPMPAARIAQWQAVLRRAGVTKFAADHAGAADAHAPQHLDFAVANPRTLDLARSLRRVRNVQPRPAVAQTATNRPPAGTSVLRVDLRQLDELFAELGELHSQLRILNKLPYGAADWERTMRNVQAAATRGVQRAGGLRLSSLEPLMREFERAAATTSEQLRKPIRVERTGAGLKVARETIERLRPLIPHVARNAVVHGIEAAAVRQQRGKPATGTIRLHAASHANAVRLTISDDGGGVDTATLQKKAHAQGLQIPSDVLELLFVPGLSTKDNADDLAGRGVGLDAVREAVGSVGGTVHARHTPQQGFVLTLDVPVPLSLQPVLEIVANTVPLGLLDEGWQTVDAEAQSGPWAWIAGHPPAGATTLRSDRAAIRVHSARALGYVYIHPLRPPLDGVLGAIGFYLDGGGIPRLIVEPQVPA